MFTKINGGFDWIKAVLFVGLIYGAIMLYILAAPLQATRNIYSDLSARMERISASK